jgi:hypothetical protein
MWEMETGWSVHHRAVVSGWACALIDNSEWMWSDGGMTLTENSEVLGDKPFPVPLCPPQISHSLNWDRTTRLCGERLATDRLGSTCWHMVNSERQTECSKTKLRTADGGLKFGQLRRNLCLNDWGWRRQLIYNMIWYMVWYMIWYMIW